MTGDVSNACGLAYFLGCVAGASTMSRAARSYELCLKHFASDREVIDRVFLQRKLWDDLQPEPGLTIAQVKRLVDEKYGSNIQARHQLANDILQVSEVRRRMPGTDSNTFAMRGKKLKRVILSEGVIDYIYPDPIENPHELLVLYREPNIEEFDAFAAFGLS